MGLPNKDPEIKVFTCLLENRSPLLLSGMFFPFEVVTILVGHSSSIGILILLKFAEISLDLFYHSRSFAGL